METIMKPLLSIVVLPLAFLSAGPAFAQSMCVKPIMGANLSADFDVQAQGCTYDIQPRGTLTSSEISQRPQHGTVMVDKDTLTYVPTAGYRGADSFAITAQGKSVDEKAGTSVLSFRVNVK